MWRWSDIYYINKEYTFTTKLVKATPDWKIVGSADGIVSHAGCIVYNDDAG